MCLITSPYDRHLSGKLDIYSNFKLKSMIYCLIQLNNSIIQLFSSSEMLARIKSYYNNNIDMKVLRKEKTCLYGVWNSNRVLYSKCLLCFGTTLLNLRTNLAWTQQQEYCKDIWATLTRKKNNHGISINKSSPSPLTHLLKVGQRAFLICEVFQRE